MIMNELKELINNWAFLWFIIVAVGLVFSIVLFFMIRQFVLWYWKINRIAYLLEEQNKLLQEISRRL